MTFPPYPAFLSTKTVAASPPKTTIWTDGDADGAWSAAGNWSLGVPGSSDTAVLASSSRDIGSAASSATLEYLLIGDDYTGNLNTLKISAKKVVIRKRQGTVHLWGSMGEVWLMNTAGGGPAVTLQSTTTGNAIGTVHILASRGTIAIPANSFVDYINVTPVGGATARLTVGTGLQRSPNPLDPLADFRPLRFRVARSGYLTGSSAAVENDILGDGLYLDGAADQVTLHSRGRCRWQSNNAVGGTINVWSGLFTLAGNSNSAVTLTNITVHPEGAASIGLPAGVTTLTNPADIRPGGRLYVGPGVTETVA